MAVNVESLFIGIKQASREVMVAKSENVTITFSTTNISGNGHIKQEYELTFNVDPQIAKNLRQESFRLGIMQIRFELSGAAPEIVYGSIPVNEPDPNPDSTSINRLAVSSENQSVPVFNTGKLKPQITTVKSNIPEMPESKPPELPSDEMEQVYKKYYTRLVRHAAATLPDEANDIAQVTLINFWTDYLSQGRVLPDKLEILLFTINGRKIVDSLRRKSAKRTFEPFTDENDEPDKPCTNNILYRQQNWERRPVEEMVIEDDGQTEKLPLAIRTINHMKTDYGFILFLDILGIKDELKANITGKTCGAVRITLYRARKEFKKAVQAEINKQDYSELVI